MTKKLYTLISLLLILLSSCNKNASVKDGYVLKVRDVINENHEKHYLSEITKNIEYIPLETDSLCMMQFINELELTEEYIFVSDYKGLFQFDRNGHFVKQIGKKGQGPGEHNGRIRFTLDKRENEILIYSWGSGLINIYDLSTGLFKKSFKVEFLVNKLTVLPTGDIAFFTPEIEFDLNEVVFTDKNGHILETIQNHSRSNIKGNVSGSASVFNNNSNVYYLYNYRDTIYTLTDKKQRNLFATLDLKNQDSHYDFLITPTPEMNVLYPDFISVPFLLSNNYYLFITLQKGIYPGTINNQILVRSLFDKTNKKLCITDGFINNIDGGMDFWPRWIIEDVLIDYYQPYQLLDYYNETKEKVVHSDSFVSLIKKLDENRNPVIMLAYER